MGAALLQMKLKRITRSPIAGTIALPSAARTADQESNSWTVRDTWSAGPRFFVETTAKYVDLWVIFSIYLSLSGSSAR